KLNQANYKDKDLLVNIDQLLKDRDTFETDKDKAEKQLIEIGKALKAAGIQEADLVKAVAELETARKGEAKKVADTLTALESAGVMGKADPAKGVAALEDLKKAEAKKVADTLAAFKTAGVTVNDPVKGVEQTALARDTAQKMLDEVVAKLVDHKFLPSAAV